MGEWEVDLTVEELLGLSDCGSTFLIFMAFPKNLCGVWQ